MTLVAYNTSFIFQILLLTFTGYGLSIRVAYKTLLPHVGTISGTIRGQKLENFVRRPDRRVTSLVDPGLTSPAAVAPPLQEVVPANLNPTSATGRPIAPNANILVNSFNSDPSRGFFGAPLLKINPVTQPIDYSSSALPLGHSTIVLESEVPLASGKELFYSNITYSFLQYNWKP